MEEESFEDDEVAHDLNQHYVAIKVDREERPDVDVIYMSAVQSLTGRGGWPMSGSPPLANRSTAAPTSRPAMGTVAAAWAS
jgi:hypothetical protein